MKRLFFPLFFLCGCGSPMHLQYDHGRASSQAFSAQGNLARPGIEDDAVPLSGTEALEIRSRVFEQSTDQESGKAEFVQEIGVE